MQNEIVYTVDSRNLLNGMPDIPAERGVDALSQDTGKRFSEDIEGGLYDEERNHGTEVSF